MDGSAPQSQQACFRLAAACCRFPGSAQRDEAVIAAARDVDDWPLFLSLLRRHRIEALAQTALAAADAPIPDGVAAALRQRAQAIAQRNLAMAAETARLQGLLDAAGLPSLVLKGAPLAQLAFGSIAFKFSQDVDFLVAPEHRDAAIACLESEGYLLVRPVTTLDDRRRALVAAYGREVALRHPERPVPVELRWQAVNSPSLLGGVTASSAHQSVALGGALSVRTLRDDDLFAYLCVHGGGHGWSRLQWLADFNAFAARKGDTALLPLYDHAQNIGAGICAMTALALCRDVLGLALPSRIARDIDRSARANLAARMSLGSMQRAGGSREAGRFDTTRIVLMQMLFGSRPMHYASLLRDLGFRLDDMLAWPLPRALHFVYPLMRLPLWLWRKIGAGASQPRREAGSA